MNPSTASSAPIFIHSLFRAGSTYLFQVFRRSPANYWCYQEPLHEIAWIARDEPAKLLDYTGFRMASLHHPPLDRPYFQELHATHSTWRPLVRKEVVFDDYFGAGAAPARRDYVAALIAAARGRVVLQECRTSGRIAAIRADVGGVHLYLWRNPWDQWWSTKTTAYFDAALQMILNAAAAPAPILHLRQQIGFVPFHHPDIETEIAHFASRPLSAEDGYLAFFVLWSLALLEASAHADALLNIDMLSGSDAYRAATLKVLADLGIGQVHFDDCNVHHSTYGSADRQFFEPIEERAGALLREAGVDATGLQTLQRLRESNAFDPHALQARDGNMEDGVRLREVVRRLETQSAAARRASDGLQSVLRGQLDDARTALAAMPEKLESDAGAPRQRELQQEVDAQAALLRERERELKASNARVREIEAERVAQAAAHARQLDAAAESLVRERQRVTDLESRLADAGDTHGRQVAMAAESLERERQRALDLEARLAKSREQVQDLHNQNHRWWSMADTLSRELQGVYAGRSWRVTAPLRRGRAMLLRARAGLVASLGRTHRVATQSPGARGNPPDIGIAAEAAVVVSSTAAGASSEPLPAATAHLPEGAREVFERLQQLARHSRTG